MLSTGQLLADRYRLSRRIAVGGMGEVWEAGDTRLDRTVAVKVLKAELSDDAEFLHRFRTEARTTASLNHPNIAGVHDYGETTAGEHSIAYLVMELVEGEPLAGILARERRIGSDRMLDIVEQAGNALQAAHERGLVHRDVKPGNILVTATGQVKLTDFGIAKAADAAPVTRNGMVMGTAHYIAPEQALGHDAEPASDVYSLAVCGYECLAGHRPFLSENAVTVAMMHIRDLPPPLPVDVPPGPRALIEATLAKDPRQRYSTGGEFANAVAAVRAGRPLPAPAQLAAYAPAPTMAMAPQAGPGPGSHPAMQPVAQHAGPHSGVLGPIPPQQQKRGPSTGFWVAIAVIAVGLIVLAAFLLAKLIGSDDDQAPGGTAPPATSAPVGDGGVPQQGQPGGGERSTDEPTPGDLPAEESSRPAEPTGRPEGHTRQPGETRQQDETEKTANPEFPDNAPGGAARAPGDGGLQGMMSPLNGTERNGTDQ